MLDCLKSSITPISSLKHGVHHEIALCLLLMSSNNFQLALQLMLNVCHFHILFLPSFLFLFNPSTYFLYNAPNLMINLNFLSLCMCVCLCVSNESYYSLTELLLLSWLRYMLMVHHNSQNMNLMLFGLSWNYFVMNLLKNII